MKYVLKTSAPSRASFNLERDLNPQQRAVVEAEPGKILVLAGAGTGKTRALTYRVAKLVADGCAPERILLCTFTNRAAKEMVERVEGLLALDMRACAAGTFHHVGNRLLRAYGEHVGIAHDFGILDPEDARTLLSTVISEQGLKTLTARRFPPPKLLSSLIGLAGGTRRPLADVVRQRAPNVVEQIPAIERVALQYAQRKRALNVCDFDDLLHAWHQLLVDPEVSAVAAEIQERFDHVLVDEYQDINALQGAICDRMAARSGSLTCVGDDAQSIYSFRGADFSQIHDFSRRHPGATVLELTINYRSTPPILELANRSISNNREQHPKELRPVKHDGVRPALIPLRDVFQQAELIAQRVLELHHEQSLPLRKMAVLYRNHSHSLELQVELSRRQIPFGVRSGVRFFEQAHIKDVVAYLRARENPQDALAWSRLLKLWPGIGTQTADRLSAELAGTDAHLAAEPSIVSAGRVASPLIILRDKARTAAGRTRPALERLAQLWAILADRSHQNPGQMIREVVEAHYAEYAERTFTNAATRKDDLEHLAGYAERYPSAQEFLSELALVQGFTAETIVSAEAPDDQLVLSTIHQAKGLEWPVCFMLWLAEGRFPMPQATRTPAELEEERRLFYVAATRAADELYLCYPTIEEGRDGPSKLMRPSRFLVELDHSPPVFERWQIEEQPTD